MASLMIDFCYDGDLTAALDQYAAKHGVTTTVINPHGPSGCWPEVKLTGTDEAIRAVALDYYAAGQGESEEFALSLITA